MNDQHQPREFKLLLTAQEAYPVLEREFMAAKQEIVAGFRIFDPWTTLRSPEAQGVGDSWFDLIVATLNRSVRIELFLSDFDPVIGMSTHSYAWDCVRGLSAAAEASENPKGLVLKPDMHPARVGILPRLLLWPRLIKEIAAKLEPINEKPLIERQAFLRKSPWLAQVLTWRGDKLVARRGPPPLMPVTHHQKLAVFDNKRLYIGGLDLNDRRYDTPKHERAADETWHDTQVLVDGPAAAEAADHLRSFQDVVAGQRPKPMRHLLRTISARRRFSLPFLSPKPVLNELAEAHRDQIANSHTLIYLETQFFRDRWLAGLLAKRARVQPDLSLIVILPAAPEDAAFVKDPGSDVAYGEYLQTKSLEIVNGAFGDRVFVGSPAQPRASEARGRATHYGAPLVYLHAKVSVFDDRAGIISSANLNGRSLAWDTEAGISTQNAAETALLTRRCFEHWLGKNAEAACHNITTAQQAWARMAALNAGRPPNTRSGFLLPYRVAPAEALARNLPGVPDQMV